MLSDTDIATHFGLETAAVRRLVNEWCEKLPSADVYDAIAKAIRYKARSWRYVERILRTQLPRQSELKPQRAPATENDRFRIPDVEIGRYLRSRAPEMYCAYCGNRLPESKRSDARYCSARCRLYGHRRRQRLESD